MKFFALYNYMFEKCIDTDDIFNDKERLQEVEENFARRQACFNDVLVDDYTKTQRIHFTKTVNPCTNILPIPQPVTVTLPHRRQTSSTKTAPSLPTLILLFKQNSP